MEKNVPLDVLARNISLVRNLSLLNKKHKKRAILWSSIIQHAHIDCLEIHDAVFTVKKLFGPYNHTLVELNLSGNCERMHPFLLIFVERQAHLQSLELTRFQFTASDWKRIITNKPNLRKLVISSQCEFLDHKTFDDPAADNKSDKRNERKDRQKEIKVETKDRKGEQPTDMDVDSTPGPNNNSHRGNNSTNTATTSKGPRRSPRKNRAKLVNQDLVNARDIGILPITLLVLRNNRLLRPFQKSILEACPHLEQLEICYSQKADGSKVATLARENCPKIRRLTLHSIRQPWTLAMINGMPKSVEELILFTGQLDLQMAMAIKKRKDTLTKLEFDFGRGSKGKRRLACILSILRECTKLREFAYHSHAEDRIFKAMMFKNSWNLPNLRKLHLHGVSSRAKYGGIAQVTSPEGWRQVYGGRQHCCCSARSFEEVRNQGRGLKSPLFDVALLNHVKDLPMLSEVVITEGVYRKRLD
ncbi:hypothetical protein BGZ97_001797 [Linnemannia gamsii]|uniref:Uncharacterized protein n=1 Tax=Linnemannia gamsii TaxID=64522 RepID=A0A9P6QVP6_9FUNG|nr:hypothetical protein BGZ97_001797 [Linnemannia gamsii]